MNVLQNELQIERNQFERQWEDGQPIKVRIAKTWCPATVVRRKGIMLTCRLDAEVRRVVGEKRVWLFWKVPDVFIYSAGHEHEIIPRLGANILPV